MSLPQPVSLCVNLEYQRKWIFMKELFALQFEIFLNSVDILMSGSELADQKVRSPYILETVRLDARHSGMVVTTAASLQEGPGFVSRVGFTGDSK